MENKNLTATETKKEGFLVKLGAFLNKHSNTISFLLLVAIMVGGMVFADADSSEALWATFSTIIKKWVTRLGAVVMFAGGITFALGWKSDDAEQKSRGISTIIAGGLVVAVAALTATFFA